MSTVYGISPWKPPEQSPINAAPPFSVGDKVMTDFYKKDRHLVRTVTKVDRWCSQTGWRVCTVDKFGRELNVDADWFTRAPA